MPVPLRLSCRKRRLRAGSAGTRNIRRPGNKDGRRFCRIGRHCNCLTAYDIGNVFRTLLVGRNADIHEADAGQTDFKFIAQNVRRLIGTFLRCRQFFRAGTHQVFQQLKTCFVANKLSEIFLGTLENPLESFLVADRVRPLGELRVNGTSARNDQDTGNRRNGFQLFPFADEFGVLPLEFDALLLELSVLLFKLLMLTPNQLILLVKLRFSLRQFGFQLCNQIGFGCHFEG